MKFLHSMIRVVDLEKSLAFYKDLLGLIPSTQVRLKDCTLYYLKDEKTNVEIELTVNDENPQNGYTQGTAFGHFAFEVDDMNEIAQKVSLLGYKWMYEPFYMDEIKTQIAFIKDPDGNEIEFIEKQK